MTKFDAFRLDRDQQKNKQRIVFYARELITFRNLLFADKFLGNVKVEDDFIQVDVVMPWGKTKSDVHMHVFPKKEVLARPLKPGGIPLNVALIMFDSVSAANFRRKMPKSLEYLTNDLNSVLMQGKAAFNISFSF